MTFDSGKAAAVSSGRLAVVLSACIGCGTGLETVYVLLSDTRSALEKHVEKQKGL